MSARSHVYSSCFCRQSAESACGSLVTARPASTTEWTSKSVPEASKMKALGLAKGNLLAAARGLAVWKRGGVADGQGGVTPSLCRPTRWRRRWPARRFDGFDAGLDET